jgi:hypothetical protein
VSGARLRGLAACRLRALQTLCTRSERTSRTALQLALIIFICTASAVSYDIANE